MVDLLVERLRVVRAIAAIKRLTADGGPAIRPGREAAILRRLVERSAHGLPGRPRWCACGASYWPPPPGRRRRWPLPPARLPIGPSCGTLPATISARRRRSSGPPAGRRPCGSLAEGAADLAVLPLPAEDESWWAGLLDTSDPPAADRGPPAIRPRRPEADGCGALVVGCIEPEPSGDDLTLLAAADPAEVGRARLLDLLAGAGLAPRWLATRRPGEAEPALHLLELDGLRRRATILGLPPPTAAGSQHRLALRVAWRLCPSPRRRRLTRAAARKRPRSCHAVAQAAARHSGNRALCRRQVRRHRQADCEVVVEREPAGPEPARRSAAYRELAGELHRYPDGSCTRASPDPRPAPQSRPRGDRLRRRLGRADRAPGPRLCRARRRGALQPPRLSDVPPGRAGGRRAPGAGARARPQGRCRCAAGAVTSRTRLVFLANPNNPTGSYLSVTELRRLAGRAAGRGDPGDRRRLCRICRRDRRLRQRLRSWLRPPPTR